MHILDRVLAWGMEPLFHHPLVRFSHQNDRICDFSHREPDAGLHRHVIESPEEPEIVCCIACGRAWVATVDRFGERVN